MNSIRRQLLLWLVIGFSAALLVAAVGVYRQARHEARALFDFQLQQMASAFPGQGFGALAIPTSREAAPDDLLVVQIWDESGTQVYVSRPGIALDRGLGMGFATIATPEGEWRVYSTVAGDNIVRVMQPTNAREELAEGMALRTILPLIVLLPLLIGFTWLIVGRGLKPLNDVAAAVGARSAEVLDPLSDRQLPVEVRPLVLALNALLQRLGKALDRQRAFIADAAHELRTPVTALSLQIEAVERAASEAARTVAVTRLKQGIARATRLVGQLLTLARNEPDAAERPHGPIDIAVIARDVLAERAPIADVKSVELGYTGPHQATLPGDADGLRAMIGNLVDNALQHTPEGGGVEVTITAAANGTRLTVTDTGPGIPDGERERVFERFYRGADRTATGSGLGLAIVHNVARRHGATIDLGAAPGGGLMVVVNFAALNAQHTC